ncbi:unnamed protein product [Polarella glacialis]|uniref:Uncharacterized protein n=1 Tax=Polarella glacialis TaxID=89957 RepID=A0A813I078_POLGL|nr:unnamed protein product [Polarella glacialis]
MPARVSLSRLIRKHWLSQKKRSFQRSYMTTAVKLELELLRQVRGSSAVLRYASARRGDVFEYPQDVPTSEHRLVYSYYSFDLDAFQEVVQEGLEWVSEYKSKTGFSPSGFAVYFVTTSGQRVGGPYASRGPRTKFLFDPLYHDPCDDKWALFVQMFSAWACAKGGRPALNQTVGIEKYPEWGASDVSGTPKARFCSEWMRAFFDAKDQDTNQTPARHTPDSRDTADTTDALDNQDAADTIDRL